MRRHGGYYQRNKEQETSEHPKWILWHTSSNKDAVAPINTTLSAKLLHPALYHIV